MPPDLHPAPTGGAAMAKATATKARARASASGRRPQPGAALRRWALVAGLAAVVLAVAAGGWAVGRGGGDRAGQVRIEHAHGLGITPANGVLYAATHHGVFQLPPDGPARRVGDGQQDTMGFTVAGANHFLASGHPAEGHEG